MPASIDASTPSAAVASTPTTSRPLVGGRPDTATLLVADAAPAPAARNGTVRASVSMTPSASGV